MKKATTDNQRLSQESTVGSLQSSGWFNWSAVATGFLVFWAVVLVGVSVLWWSGGLATIRSNVIEQMKANAIKLMTPEGWR